MIRGDFKVKKRNILINLMTDKLQEQDFKEISKLYKKNFEIFNFQFCVEEVFPDILGAILKELESQSKVNIKNDIIFFQTNIADLAHFSMKFYSEYIDAVIVYPKKVDFLINYDKSNLMIIPIIQTQTDMLRLTKVYTHFIPTMDAEYLVFLNDFSLFNDIEIVERFELPTSLKMSNNLNYKFDDAEILNEIPGVAKYIEINIQMNEKKIEGYDYLQTFSSFLMAIQYNMKANLNSIVKQNNFANIISSLRKATSIIQDFSVYIYRYLNINQDKLPLNEFATLNYITILFKDSEAYRRQFEYLKKNINNIDIMQAHALITNSHFYESKMGVKRYSNLFKDRMEIREKIIQKVRSNIDIPQAVYREKNNIAIIAGQLLNTMHSPTKWVLDYANNLKKFNPQLNIKIFVEDWANYSPNELVWNISFSSVFSSSVADVHKEYLDSSIEVYYSDATLAREERIQKDILEICEFKPSLIYKLGSKYNIAIDLLYPYFPIVSQTIYGAEDNQFTDIFTGGFTLENIDYLYKEQNMFNVSYMPHHVGIENIESKVVRTRESFDWTEEDFLLVSVGNRLDVEMTEEFIDTMINILSKDDSVKWLIVGASSIKYINDQYSYLVQEQRIKYLSYERYLFDLYKMCDVYVNPLRRTGGHSVAIAMKAELPVVAADKTSDVAGFIGPENCITLSEFAREVFELKTNPQYYREKSNMLFERINKEFSFEKTNKDLIKIFELSESKFVERNQTN
ncbi:glycosyltransferase [Bacillus ndiopicus]|uniref:glycosyltransferase n=1 Tax=Bacillus ndiopicus TaxID=1347368 RepID=UPI0005A5FFEA|nr:glycosyltransferase [Bacillus ndiopicus]